MTTIGVLVPLAEYTRMVRDAPPLMKQEGDINGQLRQIAVWLSGILACYAATKEHPASRLLPSVLQILPIAFADWDGHRRLVDRDRSRKHLADRQGRQQWASSEKH